MTINKTTIIPKKQTLIKTSLPYCLYKVDERFFKIDDSFNTKIRFIKVETKQNRRSQDSNNIEAIRDRWGIQAHSDVEMLTDKEFDSEEKAEKFALKNINNFVLRYRFYNKDSVHLVPLIKEDFFGFNLQKPDGKGSFAFTFGGGITTYNPLAVHEMSNQIEVGFITKKEILFWEELVLNADQYLYQGDYRHSVLESVIALELVISKFIIQKCATEGIKQEDAENFIKDIGITGNIKITLKLLLGSTALPNEEILQKCKGGIEIRNKIVHKGRKEVSEGEARDTLENIKKLINFLLSLNF